MRQLLQQLMRLWDRATPAGRFVLLVVPLVVVAMTQRPAAPVVPAEAPVIANDPMAFQRAHEQHLSQKAQTVLDRALGYEGSLVRVNADLKFARQRETSETITPQSPSIARLSVTVMLAPPNVEPGQSVEAALGIPQAEVERLVKEAVGFTTGRDSLLLTLTTGPTESTSDTAVGPTFVEQLKQAAYPLALAIGAFALLVFVLSDSRREDMRLKLKTRQKHRRIPAPAQIPLAVLPAAPPIVARPEPQPELRPEPRPEPRPLVFPAPTVVPERPKKSGADIDVSGHPAESLRQIDSASLATALQHEHPRAVAIALRRMESGQAADVLQRLAPNLRVEAFLLMAQGLPEHAGLVHRVLQAVVETCASGSARFSVEANGSPFQHIADVLQSVTRDERRALLAALELADAAVFAEVEARLYDFADVLRIEHRSLRRLLDGIDLKVLAIALCGASLAVSEAVLGNITERVRSMLHQEVEFANCVSSTQVEVARREVADMIREHDKADSIVWLGEK